MPLPSWCCAEFFPTAVCEKMFGEELGPGNEPCEGWNQPVLLKTPSLEPPVGDKCNCHEWDELVPEFIADFARVHKLDGGRMKLAREATAVCETGETEAIHALIADHHKFGKRLSDMQLALLSQNRKANKRVAGGGKTAKGEAAAPYVYGDIAREIDYGRAMVPKARAWASCNKSTPCKANSRQKKYYGVVKGDYMHRARPPGWWP